MSSLESFVNDQFDSRLIEVLYAIDNHEDIRDIPIGSVRSRDEEHDSSSVERRIDQFMKEVGADGAHWTRLFLGGIVDDALIDPRIQFSEADRRHFELNGISAGEFLTKLVYDKLPIEWSNEGSSSASLSFATGTDYVLNIRGEGTYDTAYIYDHEYADLDEDEPVESEVIYEMTFTADLLTVKP